MLYYFFITHFACQCGLVTGFKNVMQEVQNLTQLKALFIFIIYYYCY
jgi:hypothetical protein